MAEALQRGKTTWCHREQSPDNADRSPGRNQPDRAPRSRIFWLRMRERWGAVQEPPAVSERTGDSRGSDHSVAASRMARAKSKAAPFERRTRCAQTSGNVVCLRTKTSRKVFRLILGTSSITSLLSSGFRAGVNPWKIRKDSFASWQKYARRCGN